MSRARTNAAQHPKQVYVARDDADGEMKAGTTVRHAVQLLEAWGKGQPYTVAVYELKEVITVRNALKIVGKRKRAALGLEELVLGDGVESA